MKRKIIYLGFLFFVPLISCVGQEQSSKFDLFVKKNFRDITLPAKSDTLRPGDESIPYEDIKQFFSDKSGAFYGKVDWEGYAPYKYFSPTWKFKRSENVSCLIYAASRYGGQNILATYSNSGEMIDSLIFITGIYLGPDHDLYQVFTVESDFIIKAIKLTDECIQHSKYDNVKKVYSEPLFKGQIDTIYYKIDDDGKFRHLSTVTRKGLLFMNSKSGKVEVDSVKAGLK